MKSQKKKKMDFTKDEKIFNSIIETIIDTETVIKIIEDNYFQKQIQETEDADVDINHLENIFTNETYYLAMKIVPLLERKVLYLSYIENMRLNDICKRLKLQKKDIISLREKGIKHFKYNLNTLYKANKHKKGGNV